MARGATPRKPRSPTKAAKSAIPVPANRAGAANGGVKRSDSGGPKNLRPTSSSNGKLTRPGSRSSLTTPGAESARAARNASPAQSPRAESSSSSRNSSRRSSGSVGKSPGRSPYGSDVEEIFGERLLGAESLSPLGSSRDGCSARGDYNDVIISVADAAYEVTGELDDDVGVGMEKSLGVRYSDPYDLSIKYVDAEVQTDYVPGFGEVAPEVNPANVLRLLNRARRNPKSMIPLLERRSEKIDAHDRIQKADGVYLQLAEGRKAVEACIRIMRLAKQQPELELSEELCCAAQDHVDDIGPKGLTGHSGSDGCSTWDRVARHCEWRRACAENIDYMSTSAPEIVLSMLVDDDVPSRGHRKTILKEDFTKVGIAYGPHKDFGTVCVLVFAGWVGPKMEIGTRKASAKGKMTKELRDLLDSTPFGVDFGAQAAARLRTGGSVSAELKWDGKRGEIKVVLVHDGPKGRTTRTLKGQWKS